MNKDFKKSSTTSLKYCNLTKELSIGKGDDKLKEPNNVDNQSIPQNKVDIVELVEAP
jgi:hypothetical protein